MTERPPDPRLSVLIAEHEAVREDARNATLVLVTLAAAAVVLAGGVSTLLLNPDWLDAYPWLHLFVPAIPLVFVAYAIQIAASIVIRSYYARYLERELYRASQPAVTRAEALRIPSWAHFEVMLTSPTHSGPVSAIAYWVVVVGIDAFVVGVIVLSLMQAEGRLLVTFFAVIYGAVWLYLNGAGYANIARAYRKWIRLTARLDEELARPLFGRGCGHRERSLAGYLILPRPNDLLKVMLLPAVFGIALLASWMRQAAPQDYVGIAVVWAVFDLVLYQGRYMLNDVHDRLIDRAHTDPSRASRFPYWTWPPWAMHAVFFVFALRYVILPLLAVAVLLLRGSAYPGMWLLGATVAVWAYSWWYEKERDWTANDGPQGTWELRRLLLAVGVGYGLRALLGVALAYSSPQPLLLVVASFGGVLLGVALVSMTWALEATSCVVNGKWENKELRKGHLRVLLDRTGAKQEPATPGADPTYSVGSLPVSRFGAR